MSIFFDTKPAAIEHLTSNGWTQLANGRWVSRDKSCAAHILLAPAGKVLVQFWEIEAA